MKTTKHVFLFLLAYISFTSVFAQTDQFDEIAKNIKSSNVSNLSNAFNSTIELGLPGNDAAFSKPQAEMILKDFFAKNVPTNFIIEHRGTSGGNSKFANGTLDTSTGRYKVYILIKGNIIYELRFDKQ